MKLWNWLDGKKTKIGAVVYFVALLLQHFNLVDVNTVADLQKVADAFMAVGLVHSAQKAM